VSPANCSGSQGVRRGRKIWERGLWSPPDLRNRTTRELLVFPSYGSFSFHVGIAWLSDRLIIKYLVFLRIIRYPSFLPGGGGGCTTHGEILIFFVVLVN
jgi:hypothetical protein